MTTVTEVFAGAGLIPVGQVRWGVRIPIDRPGVYVVATTRVVDARSSIGACPIDPSAVQTLLRARPEAQVDGLPATEHTIATRLAAMWIASEPVLYIGLAGSSLASRVNHYYGTPLGARSPHAGGWPLKTLSILDQLWVHFAPCSDPARAEREMVDAFAASVPAVVLAELHDPTAALPFANLMFPAGRKKRHGMTGVKAPQIRGGSRVVLPLSTASTTTFKPTGSSATRFETQTVTDKDVLGGRIRVPSATKRAFPADRQTIGVELRGTVLSCRWDPRLGPDRERSGLISVPRSVLQRLVAPGERLTVTRTTSGVRLT